MFHQRLIQQVATAVQVLLQQEWTLKSNPDAKIIAVDPSVIPMGSKVYVEGYGYAMLLIKAER